MNPLRTNFWIWLSGSDPDAVAESNKRIQRKHKKIGATVLIPVGLATVSMFFAAPYIGIDSLAYRISASIYWGTIIFIIDVAILSTLKKPYWGEYENIARPSRTKRTLKWVEYYLTGFARLVFAIAVGIVISHPIVLKVFESDINDEIRVMKYEEIDRIRFDGEFKIDSITKTLYSRLDSLNKEIECRESVWFLEVSSTVKGTEYGCMGGVTSGKPHEGFRAEKIKAEWDSLKVTAKILAENITDVEIKLSQQIQENIDSVTVNYSNGYLNRVKALERVKNKSYIQEKPGSTRLRELLRNHVSEVQWGLMLFLISLDVLPVIVKILSSSDKSDEEEESIDSRRSEARTSNLRAFRNNLEYASGKDETYRQGLIDELYRTAEMKDSETIWDRVIKILITGPLNSVGNNGIKTAYGVLDLSKKAAQQISWSVLALLLGALIPLLICLTIVIPACQEFGISDLNTTTITTGITCISSWAIIELYKRFVRWSAAI